MRRDGLIGIANARRFAEECDALLKIGLALALDRDPLPAKVVPVLDVLAGDLADRRAVGVLGQAG